jgi:nicotinamide-nucleotide amidase
VATSLIAVGDELLAGFTLDTNSHWLAERLRLLGRPLRRITVVRDRVDDIAEQVQRDLSDAETEDVFCCGGLGPTPDDRTLEAVAHALKREMVLWQPALERIERRVRLLHEAGLIDTPEVSEGHRRMARIPADPDHVFRNRRGLAPGLMYRVQDRRLFLLPGVPAELRGIFTEELAPQFLSGRSAPVVRELRFLQAMESRFYPIMHQLETSHPDVSVGSYPQSASRELVIRFSGESERRVVEAMALVRRWAATMGFELAT